jgi:hypothetical protein
MQWKEFLWKDKGFYEQLRERTGRSGLTEKRSAAKPNICAKTSNRVAYYTAAYLKGLRQEASSATRFRHPRHFTASQTGCKSISREIANN